jgi:hypothetical protein
MLFEKNVGEILLEFKVIKLWGGGIAQVVEQRPWVESPA